MQVSKLHRKNSREISRLGMHKSNLLLVERNQEVEINLAYSSRTLGEKQYELTNHLGNVLAVISDKKLADNEPDVVSTSDYFPYGMGMPGRSAMSEEYRFGFNGKENINEVNGWQDYGERMYNVLTGRFFSPDPLIAYGQQYAELSSYQFAGNTPIWATDLDGLEPCKFNGSYQRKSNFFFKMQALRDAWNNFIDGLQRRNHKKKDKKEDINNQNPISEIGQPVNNINNTLNAFTSNFSISDHLFSDWYFGDNNSTEFTLPDQENDVLEKLEKQINEIKNNENSFVTITVFGTENETPEVLEGRGNMLIERIREMGYNGKIDMEVTNAETVKWSGVRVITFRESGETDHGEFEYKQEQEQEQE